MGEQELQRPRDLAPLGTTPTTAFGPSRSLYNQGAVGQHQGHPSGPAPPTQPSWHGSFPRDTFRGRPATKGPSRFGLPRSTSRAPVGIKARTCQPTRGSTRPHTPDPFRGGDDQGVSHPGQAGVDPDPGPLHSRPYRETGLLRGAADRSPCRTTQVVARPPCEGTPLPRLARAPSGFTDSLPWQGGRGLPKLEDTSPQALAKPGGRPTLVCTRWPSLRTTFGFPLHAVGPRFERWPDLVAVRCQHPGYPLSTESPHH